jgi:hypothetical protein
VCDNEPAGTAAQSRQTSVSKFALGEAQDAHEAIQTALTLLKLPSADGPPAAAQLILDVCRNAAFLDHGDSSQSLAVIV